MLGYFISTADKVKCKKQIEQLKRKGSMLKSESVLHNYTLM